MGVLDAVHDFLGRFIAYPSSDCHIAHTLWVAHTHLMGAWESTPRIAFLSPEPGSGKTRALEVTEVLVPRPVMAINCTAAFLFRRVGDPDGLPTILFDEIDSLFGPKAREHEEVRALLNAGHRRGAVAGRCVVRGKTIVTEELPAYSALALAGLGDLPDTLLSRSVVVRMRRRKPSEKVEPFRERLHRREGERLRDDLAAWADGHTLGDVWPDLPDGITDREADNWEPLIAVADAAGGAWPNRARVAAVAHVAAAKGSTPSLGVRLLADVRTVFGGRTAMSTADLLAALNAMEEAPWGDLRGRELNARGLARRLGEYDVRSTDVRLDDWHGKGYKREDLHDAWERYLAGPLPEGTATSATNATEEAVGRVLNLFPDARVIDDEGAG